MLPDHPVEVLDAEGNPVRVTSRGSFSAEPARLTAPGGRATALVGRSMAGRRKVVGPGPQGGAHRTGSGAAEEDPERALLLCYRQRQWYLEGIYE